MSAVRLHYLLVLWFVIVNCETYDERPKIKSENGDLIFESAYDRNIYLKTNGPKSVIYLDDLNINALKNISKYSAYLVSTGNKDEQSNFNKNNDIINRESMEKRNDFQNNVQLNITYLTRRFNNLKNRIRALELSVNNKNKDQCQSHPCENGGTCLNLANGFYCLCPSNWKGASCNEDVNECRNYAGTDLGCQNGATCINKPGSYECLCRPGWYGLDCTRKAKDCTGGDYEMCGHGTCVSVTTGEGIKCFCNQGWTTNGTSVACLTDVDECASGQTPRCSANPKVECINLPGSFKCGQCPVGYEGDGYVCHDIDECLTLNGGCSTNPMVTCHNTIGSRICGSCPPGFQGDGVTCVWRGSCAINRGGCHPSAQCIEHPMSSSQIAQCVCPYGMEGDGVGLRGCYIKTNDNSTQNCGSNPCGEHGHCHELNEGYTCICLQGYAGAHCERLSNLCSSNPCQNGGTCRPDEKISRGYRCECSALYSGILCQIHSQPCGGVLDSEEGSIVYPLTNTTYKHNARCAWVIHTLPDKVINVTFSKFDIEADSECYFDFVQIHDGRSSANQLIGRFCGNTFPNGGNIISSHNNLYFWFRSDHSVAKEGFALHWTSIPPVCGGEVDASKHGRISSPGSPGKYPPNRDCYWHLSTTLGKRIQLHFFQLDIEVHVNCSFDYIAIYDGESTSDPLINKYCNSSQPEPIQSSSSEMLIHFHSDATSNGYGFQIVYAPIEGVPGCGGFYTTDRGEIVSPSFDGAYLNNLLCEYRIKTRQDTKIKLTFTTFSLEKSSSCRYDFLKVFDGSSLEAPLVGKFCGNIYPKTYTSTTNELFLLFKSDITTSSGGFKIKYEALCGKTIVGDSGIIKSPGYPFSYPKQTVCEYFINTTPGKAIVLTFQDFDIEDNRYYHCLYDHVEIRDGPTVNSTLLGKYCGGAESTPPIQTSTYNYMYIKFNSDMSITGRGFYANYTTINIKCGGIYKEATGIINYPVDENLSYTVNQSCTWIVVAPEGMHIKLSWNRFDLEDMVDCNSDYVELIELDNNNDENILGRYCGDTLPPALTTSSNRLRINFISDSTVSGTGFSVSYSLIDEKTHCGGLYVKSHGFIYSPGWPHSYESNRDCTWKISVPKGQQIFINITDFDLERPIRDNCDLGDYLLIRDGSSEQSPLIAKICGYYKSKRVVSTANNIYIHFHSDFYLSGKGFKIEWDGTILGCGGTLTSIQGMIASPNYPQNYNENSECFYRIVTSSGSRIAISFSDLDLEHSERCTDDYLEIFDGRDSNSHSFGRFCHKITPLNDIMTSHNYAFIKFRSDILITKKGFLLNYHTICNNNVSGPYGVIESPGYPNKYPINSNCLWTITVPKGNKINITFTNFDLFSPISRPFYRIFRPYNRIRSTDPCSADYLQVKETSEEKFGPKLCGTIMPRLITSEKNSVQIKFVSTSPFPHKGFRLEWLSFGCGGYIQKASGSLFFDRALSSSGEIECEWTIETPLGTAVSISFSEFYMLESRNCTDDAIEVYNGQSADFPLLSKFCHRQKIILEATSNYMFIRLIKHSTLHDVYFKSQFKSVSGGCGGSIVAPSGMIHSKNYPKNYDNNLDCLWIISVPKYHRIKLEFTDFDLYSAEDDHPSDDNGYCGDFIKIYDSENIFNTNFSHLLCPGWNRSTIMSNQPYILVQFITDSYGSAKGFKANFTMTCGATIIANTDGVITNNEYISRNNQNCTWTILAPKNSEKVKLTIKHISLSKNSDIVTNRNCPSSYLRVFDGNDDKAPLIDEFCGSKVPPTIVSRGSALTVQLGTYTDMINGKFLAHYSSLETSCGAELTSEEGSVASPNYPLSYPTNADCEWTLSTSPGNKVYITFETFDLVYSENCNEDYLEIRENNGGGELLAVYCGKEIPSNTTTGTKLYIKFHSSNKSPSRGFLLHYGFLHGNEITGKQSGQISSPFYPLQYEGSGEFSWRILTEGSTTISIVIDDLEIPRHNDKCSSELRIYDGYDDEAPLLSELCGVYKNENRNLQTTSNVVYIKLVLDSSSIGSLFHIRWAQSARTIPDSTSHNKINCGLNQTKTVTPQSNFIFNSPNFPNPYDSDLNCEWIFKTTPGHHLTLSFKEIDLEQTPSCFADYLSIYSSKNGLQWQPIHENVCLSDFETNKMNSLSYLKVIFKSDGYSSRKGFQAIVKSECGGTIENPSGIVEVTSLDYGTIQNNHNYKLKCNWTVKVRPGRTIKANFLNFHINNSNECNTYVLLRNGESVESPILGKYCGYSHENMSDIISSSNAIHITYNTVKTIVGSKGNSQTFKLQYEELNVECGGTSILDSDHSWEIINSPNYPSIPVPYTECIWIFTGPPGEILRIDFMDRFDLESSNQCQFELVEIRDGSSELSLSKGRFCKDPGTIKTTSNTMFIRYSTQTPEPRNGFKANVTIDVCGGTIVAEKGQLTSPGYPHMLILSPGSVCQWTIISKERHVILLEFKDFDLPESEKPCQTKVSIEEPISYNGTASVGLRNICNDGTYESINPIETLSNKVIVKLHMGKPSPWTYTGESRGFKLTFNSSRPSCGGSITASEGFITTPGYPIETSLLYCQWDITTPNINRRIRLELLDFDPNHNLGILNDLSFTHSLGGYFDEKNLSTAAPVFESTGNRLSFYVWMGPISKTKHRFKARFSSDEPSLCGGRLSGIQGHLTFPNLDRSYDCSWKYNDFLQSLTNSTSFGSIYLSINMSSSAGAICRYSDSKLNIISNVLDSRTLGSLFIRNICGKHSQLTYRIPALNMDIKATQYARNPITFDLDWKLQPCGGLIHAVETSNTVLNIPLSHKDDINCAWILKSPSGIRISLKLEGTFTLDCSDEYLQIREGITETSPVIGDYCKNKMQESPLVTAFSHLYIQYYSKPQNNTNFKLIPTIITYICGGLLTQFDRVFSSPNYPKSYRENQECVWEIEAETGYRVSLQFIDRFVIEDTTNCTKDAIIIYDWIENEYKEMSRLCGRLLPPKFNSTYNKMKVVFRTDASINLEGFKAQWTSICGGRLEAKPKEGFLYSPGYPNKYYPSLNCQYEIVAPSEKIIIQFLDFELEGSYPECEYDNITMEHQSDNNYFYGVYCGKEKPAPLQIYDSVKVSFKTDLFGQRKGFKMSYSLYNCGGIVREPTTLTSGMSDNYGDNSNCTWLIEAPKDKLVVVNILYIDLESSYECYSDYIAVYNGAQINSSKRIALLCGHVNTTTILKSNENSMVFQFISDSYLNYRGFKAEVLFTYSEAVGCGGMINLNTSRQHILKTPLFNNSPVYENYLECHWTIKAPIDKVIKVEFTSFHVAPCANVNQTELGYDKCDCDILEFRDGLNPTSLLIGKYCGHSMPPQIFSSRNVLSIRFSTDGDIQSSGFEIMLTSEPSVCGQSVYTVSNKMQRVKSPGYDKGLIPRGIHCNYFFDTGSSFSSVHIRINNLDIEASNENAECDKDKIIITGETQHPNVTFGKDLIIASPNDNIFVSAYLFESTLAFPKEIVLCGSKKSLDYYITSNINIHLQTSAGTTAVHRGVELEVSFAGFCGRNYTELQGRIIRTTEIDSDADTDCYTLITVPENYTITIYFISISPAYTNDNVYLDIIDGKDKSSPLLYKITMDYPDVTQMFTTGRYLLLHNHMADQEAVNFDLIYVATNKGRGCGGYIHNEIGRVTSPLHPDTYRRKATCEWELETPSNTRLYLHFTEFDLGRACEQNYLRLVDKEGNTISSFCEETPADYTSPNNYVKIVFTTTMNNGGTGWAANFVGII
ncbi:cubilin homolog [Danaus plexippus]|uniref:cubilin homolog n=1 Tax=Danaus plexippus TaxID=13037 RepID=UPI002AB0D46E|nr:cubilin homolog [Danaus plexippus]